MSKMRRRTAPWLLVSLVLAGSMLLAGCRTANRQGQADQAPELSLTLSVEPNPPIVGKAHVAVQLADAAGKPVEDAVVAVRGDMSHAGMQPVLSDAGGGAGGSYSADFEWTMAGDWIVTVTAALPDGRTARRQFDLTVQAP